MTAPSEIKMCYRVGYVKLFWYARKAIAQPLLIKGVMSCGAPNHPTFNDSYLLFEPLHIVDEDVRLTGRTAKNIIRSNLDCIYSCIRQHQSYESYLRGIEASGTF